MAFAWVLLFWRRDQVVLLTSAVVFAVFAAYSCLRAVAGYETCRCFGAFKVSPWITFGLDIVISGLMIFAARSVSRKVSASSAIADIATPWLLGTFATFAIPLTNWAYHNRPQEAKASDEIPRSGLVILEPETWIGKLLPIQSVLTPRYDVMSGDWIIVLYHHDCPQCQLALPKYRQLADPSQEGPRILLVEVPPTCHRAQDVAPALYAALPDDREWFVQAPVEITLSNSIVQSSSLELPSIAMQVDLPDLRPFFRSATRPSPAGWARRTDGPSVRKLSSKLLRSLLWITTDRSAIKTLDLDHVGNRPVAKLHLNRDKLCARRNVDAGEHIVAFASFISSTMPLVAQSEERAWTKNTPAVAQYTPQHYSQHSTLRNRRFWK